MDDSKLFVVGKPCFYLIEMDESDFASLGKRLTHTYKHSIVCFIRGKRCATLTELFNEFAATLQLPHYFGENWAAFDECICDLDWLEGDAYILLLDEPLILLNSLDEKDVSIFIRILSNANQEWLKPNTYIPRDRPPTAFHVVFQCTATTMPIIASRLLQRNCACEIL